MRILHLEASPGWGGQEMRILCEAEGMRSRGHEIVLGVMKRGVLISEACKAGFTCYSLNFRKIHWPFVLVQLLRLIRKHRIDLINTHSSLDAWIGGIAARLSGVPVVRTRHLSTPIKKGLNSRILYGFLANFVVTTCASILPVICRQSGKRQERCRSIPTGVDPLRIAREKLLTMPLRSILGVGEKDFLIGTACFIRSWKGIDDLLQAADLLRNIPDIKWIIIGGGHDEKCRQLAKELQLDGIVHFLGHLSNPFPALASLDLFALLSTAHEGVSQAILQAAYLGKPLIATPIGGLGEVCINRKTGIQVTPFSPKQVAKAVIELKENRALRDFMGREATRLVEECFTLTRTIDQMEEVYHQMLARKFRANYIVD